MAKLSKTERSNIRLRKVHERLCKTKYPRDYYDKRLVKLNDRIEMLSKWNGKIYEDMYRYGFNPKEYQKNPDEKWNEYFDQIEENIKEISKAQRSIDKLEEKGHSLDKALKLMKDINTGRLSTSF